MNGKIIIQPNKTTSSRKNVYEVFIDDIFIGRIDYVQPKIEYVTSFGNHKVLIRTKDFSCENTIKLSSKKLIYPIEISENSMVVNKTYNLPQLVKGIIIGFLFIYTLLLFFLLYFKDSEFKISLFIPFATLLWLLFYSESNKKFSLNFK